MTRLTIDVLVHEPTWRDAVADVERVCRQAALAAAEASNRVPDAAEITIVLADDAEMRQLNRDYRGQDAPTDVLSFGAWDEFAPESGADMIPLGDVVIAFGTAGADAATTGTPLDEHLTHLVVHGILHLLGYDHISDSDAAVMEGLEIAVLKGMGIDDPYGSPHSDRT